MIYVAFMQLDQNFSFFLISFYSIFSIPIIIITRFSNIPQVLVRFSRDTEPKGHINIYMGSYVIGIGSHGLEAERSSTLQAASWITEEAGGILHLESEARE